MVHAISDNTMHHCNAGQVSDDEVLQLAAAVESCTRHPVADAIVAVAQQRGAAICAVLLLSVTCAAADTSAAPKRPAAQLARFTVLHALVSDLADISLRIWKSRADVLAAGLPQLQLEGPHTEAGEGVRGFVDGHAVAVGKRDWVQGVIASPSSLSEPSQSGAPTLMASP